MLGRWRALRAAGVLGINQRQAEAATYNARHLFPLVDDKRCTKRLARRAGMSVPATYAVIERQAEAARLDELLRPHDDFVIKPNHGSGGQGVLVIAGRSGDRYLGIDGIAHDRRELRLHILNILAGMYSLGGRPDQALIEYRVRFDPVFDAVSYLGVPDVRIIVFLGVPVMSMVRLPTHCSGGKANLHQGAIGVGVDIGLGLTTTAVWRNRIVREHPDTGAPVCGIRVPAWLDLLRLAARCYELTGLGLLGVDIVLDRALGPMLLELNARPGLSIQLANRSGLRPRFELVKRHCHELVEVERRVAFARRMFGRVDAGVPAAEDALLDRYPEIAAELRVERAADLSIEAPVPLAVPMPAPLSAIPLEATPVELEADAPR